MHTALLDRSLEALGAIRRYVSFQAKLRSQIGQPGFGCQAEGEKCFGVEVVLGDAADSTSWRVIDHCAAITRAYALFETFVDQLLREYLVFLSQSYTLAELGQEFRAKYTRGIGQLLVDRDKHRNSSIDVDTVIIGANAAITGATNYQIQPEALIRAEQNLRMTELKRLFSQCGLNGEETWITRHAAVTEFFAAQSRLSETADSELRQIVDYRNEAAHGDVAAILGPEVLIEFTHFFEALFRSITDFIQYDTLRRAKEVGRAFVLGMISESYSNNIVVAKVANTTLQTGDLIYVFGKGASFMTRIVSIQLNGIEVTHTTATAEAEVGLRIDVRARVGAELIRLV